MTTKQNPACKLADGFLRYRHARCNACVFEDEENILGCDTNKLLMENLLYLSLHPRLKCESCRNLCTSATCDYTAELVTEAGMVLKHFRKPPANILGEIRGQIKCYLRVSFQEWFSRRCTSSFVGQKDEQLNLDTTSLLFRWKKARQKVMYAYLDKFCKKQPVYKRLK